MSLFIDKSLYCFVESNSSEKQEKEIPAASSVHGTALEVLSSEEYQEILKKVRKDGLSLGDAPEVFRSDCRIVKAAVRQNGWALQYAAPAIIQNFSGKAKQRHPDKSVYRGRLKNGEPSGNGTLRLADGTKYIGRFIKGEPSGKGVFYFPDGSRYKGFVFKGKMDGEGKLIYPDGSGYIGTFAEGKMDGEGELFYPKGSGYIGTFVKGKPHGKGKIISPNGTFIEGFFIDGILEGEGKFVSIDPPIVVSGEFRHNIFISDADLGNPLFLLELFSLDSPGAPLGFSLPILCKYFQKKGYIEISQTLQEAYNLLLLSKEEAEERSKQLYQELLENPDFSKLFYYGCANHSIGLSLSREDDSILEINFFNTGEGLKEYHEQDRETGKFQTRVCVELPLDSFSEKNLSDIICNLHQRRIISDAYNVIIDLIDAEPIEIENPIYQSPQKEGNCELAWIFAYLRNTMGEKEYKKMRAELFFDTKAAASENPDSQVLLQKYHDLIKAKCERKAARALSE